MLRSRGYETVVVHSGWDALRAAKIQSPDLVILDVMMPGLDGMQVCKKLRDDPNTAHLPVIFLTAKMMMNDKIEGFQAGADDYLTKPFDIQELSLRVQAVLRRSQRGNEPTDKDQVLVAGDLELNPKTFQVSTPFNVVQLTPVEFELLYHLMKHKGQVFSSERLLHEIWGYPEGTGDPALVRMHIRNLRAKIEPNDANEPVFIRTVSRHGYFISDERVAGGQGGC